MHHTRRALPIAAPAMVAVLMTPFVTARAAAQSPPAAAPPLRVAAGQDGFAVESADGAFRLQFGVLIHADGRFALDDGNEQVVDTFAVRRARPYLRGRVARRFEFYLNPDFAGGTLVVQDAYIDMIFAPALRIRAGKGKTPFGMERLHAASNMLFMERALPNAIVPNRDAGVQALGELADGVIGYSGGVVNGVPDGASADLDTTDSKDVAGRLVVRPFARRPAASALRGINLAIAATRGRATGTAPLPALRTQTLGQPFFSYAGGATPAVADGTRTRYSPQFWYFHGPFGGWAEYVHVETPVRRDGLASTVAHDAWQVTASWVITGESATDAGTGVRPRAGSDVANGGPGAWQVAARYHSLAIDERAFTFGFAAPGASRTADAWTIGVNWYATANLRYVVNFERTVFDDDPDGARSAENALAFRTQLSF